MTVPNHFRSTRAEINLNAIGYNIEQLKKILPTNSKVMTVVKANGYGHGSVQVAKAALKAGVDYLMVALLEEAIILREKGITAPILVIGRVAPEHAYVAAENEITVSVFQLDWLKQIRNKGFTKKLSTHIELETGMGRTGICTKEELNDILHEYIINESVQLEGVFTHFATADEIESDYFHQQKARFEQLVNYVASIYPKELIVHSGNSAAGIQYAAKMNHYTRFGIATYGLYPSHEVKNLKHVHLQEAFALYSELIQVKKVRAGECISYGATYCAEQEEWIGTVPIGYGDGWRRALQGFHVLVDGKKMPIVGRICMDSMMIKLDQPYEVGTKVTLIGKDKQEEITVDDVANYLQTINYEIPCMITSRVPRVYV